MTYPPTGFRARPRFRRRRLSAGFACEPLEARTLLAAGFPGLVPATAQVEVRVDVGDDRPNLRYVESLLGDSGDPAFRDHLIAQLDRGVPRAKVARRLLESDDSQATQVRNVTRSLLGRNPTSKDIRVGVRLLDRSVDQRDLVLRIASSREYFLAHGGTNAGFLDATYRDLLGRPVEAGAARGWGRALAQGRSRRDVVAGLLGGPEYAERSIRAAYAQLGGVPSDEGLAQGRRLLGRPGGFTRLRAHVLASGVAFDQAQATTSPTTSVPGGVGNAEGASLPPSGFPLPPGMSLATTLQTIPLTLSDFNVNSAGAASDDSIWLSLESGLVVYQPATGTLSQVSSLSFESLSPVSANLVWGITGGDGTNPGQILQVTSDGASTATPALPGGDTASQVSAASDGTSWVLGGSGALYAYSVSTKSWTAVPTDGYTFKAIGVGSATNIWAVGSASGGAAAVLYYSQADGWRVDTSITVTNPSAAQGTADGAAWVVGDNVLQVKPTGGTWYLAPGQKIGVVPIVFSAVSANRAYMLNPTGVDLGLDLQHLVIGLVDQQAVSFPTFTPSQQEAYETLSRSLGVASGDLRSEYADELDATSRLSDWFTTLTVETSPPAGISQGDWDVVRTEILSEIMDVQAVNSLFTQLHDLNASIEANSALILPAIVSNVQISDSVKTSDTANLVLTALAEAAVAGIAAALPGAGAIIGSLIGSGFASAIGDIEMTNPPNSNNAIPIAYGNLASTMLAFFDATDTNNDRYQTLIVNDYGRLSAVGSAINSNLWDWPDGTTDTTASYTTNAFEVYYYQTLMPVQWQIVFTLFGDYIQYPPDIAVPSYDQVTMADGYIDGWPAEKIWFMNQVGASYDLNDSNLGPFPDPALLNDLTSVGINLNDVYMGTNGWTLNQITATT